MSRPLLETENLSKYFKISRKESLHAVDGVSFCINEGETLGVVGESGCGKSTLGRTVLRLNDVTSGKIIFDGRDITDLKGRQLKEIRNDMQMIFQDPYSSLNPRMSVRELIAEPMLISGKYSRGEIYDRVAELMATVGLAERLSGAYPHELDGGRRQRIGVARAMALNPRFIVCDEPVSALDVSIQAQILNLLMDEQDRRGLTYMFITHDLSVVRHISDNIAVMYLGKCVEYCESKQLFKNPVHPYTKALLSAIPIPDASMKNRRPQLIHGEVTNPINPKPGCRFAARCPFASEECTLQDIPLTELEPGHSAACIKANKL